MQPKDVTARAQGLPYMCSVVSCHPGDQCQPGTDINHNEHDMFLSSIVSGKDKERSKPLGMRKIELTFLSTHSTWGLSSVNNLRAGKETIAQRPLTGQRECEVQDVCGEDQNLSQICKENT